MSVRNRPTALLFAASLLVSVASYAAEYSLDFTGAKALDAEVPVLRRAEMAADVGTVPAVAVGDTLDLKLFGDVDFAFRIVAAPPAGIAGQSFIARDENGSASAIVKVMKNGVGVFVDDFMCQRQYTVRCKDGKATISERDNSQVEDGECATCSGELDVSQPVTEAETPIMRKSVAKSLALLGASDNEFPVAEQKSVVDILVAFDQGAKAWAKDSWVNEVWKDEGTIQEFADYAVDKMNTVLVNSQLIDTFSYRLVGVTEVQGNNNVVNENLLGSVRARTGAFAKLEQLRDKCGADTITLLINRTSGTTSGKGYEYSDEVAKTLTYFEHMRYACNVCDINTVDSRYTMSHETGHNMGCGHSNRYTNKPGRYGYSYGYNFTDANSTNRYTIMAYDHTSPASGTYYPIPYFSTPDISPSEYGCPLGEEGINDNRKTLLNTHAEIASLHENVMPYDWDVHFLDDDGNEIFDGALFWTSCNVTLSNATPHAEIYYTLDGTTPNKNTTTHGPSGTKIEKENVYLVYTPKTITACAVTNGVAMSIRSITLYDGLNWSGNNNGEGIWTTDYSQTPWSTYSFENDYRVNFPDLENIANATVTVQGTVAAKSTNFSAYETAYTFNGDNDALIVLKNASFAPDGDLTFNVPVSLDATSFTLTPNHTIAFNAPFGTNVTANTSYGHCTNSIAFKVCGSTQLGCNLVIAPGKNKTQAFNNFDISQDNNLSTVRFGEGTTIFKGPYRGEYGVLCNAKVVVGYGANLIFNCAAATGSNMTSAFTVEKGGTVTFNGSMEHMRRPLYLNGGTLVCNNRFDKMYAYGIAVAEDSEIKGSGYLLLRYNNEPVNVAAGKTLTLNIPTKTGSNTDGIGLIKRGEGEIVANQQLEHSGATTIEGGTFTVGYMSTDSYGTGWSVSSGAKLKVNAGGALAVLALNAESGATLSLPVSAATSLTVNGELDLDGVKLELTEGAKYSGGDSFTVITATDGLSNFSESNIISTPALADGLKWEFDVTENSVIAWVKDYGALKNELKLLSNNSGLNIKFTKDAEIGENGGIVIDKNPLVVEGLSTKAVAVTLDVEIPETTLTEEATICSWKVNDGYARCVRRTDGKLDCYYGEGIDHISNDSNFVEIVPGRHIIKIAYYSYDNDIHGGTFVYVDDKLAYRGAKLRWSKESVNRITVGGTAYDLSTRIYNGLVVHGFALIDALSNDPIPNVTSSDGSVKYEYMTQGHPCVFALPPAGGFMLDSSILRATIGSDRYDSAAISLAASFPVDKTGTIVSLVVSDYELTAFQAEYVGGGKFMLRSNDSGFTTYQGECSIDVSKPHLYTIAYDGSAVTFYVDGRLLIESDNYWGEVVNEIDFGCGYWNEWSGNGADNPNPIAGLKVYASDIELGTGSTTASENAVMTSLKFDSKYFAGMTTAEKLAYLEEQQTANGVVSPVSERLPVVDILVAFDNGGVDYVSNTGKALEEFAEEQIEKMNEVLVINKLDASYSYRLAGVCTVDATYTDINATVSLIQEGAGPCTTLRAAREMYGADTVTLLVNTSGNVLGHSSQPNYQGDMAAYHDECFSVCSISAVATGDQHTMLHENAHTLGCGHAREQYTAQDIAEHPGRYSYGYYFKDGNNIVRHTIMAYSVANNKYYQPSPYFSTSSDEFNLVLGDADNDNARVIRETCGYVGNWRDSIKPFDGDVTVYDNVTGKELLSGHVFAESISVSLASADGRAIYYTLDGTNPTKDSSVYSSPIAITADTTLTVASLDGKTLRPPREVRLFRIDSLGASIAEGVSWRTNVKYPWVDLGDGVIRSHNHTDYSYYCTTPLLATVTGPKRLTFKERSYFRGATPSQGSKYSHYEVLVDDVAHVTEEDSENSWKGNYVDIPAGTHEVAFVYSQRSAMNNPQDYKDGTPEDDDAVWLKEFILEDVECAHSSSSTEVSWAFPDDAKLTDDFAHGVLINSKGIANNLNFTTKGVCASTLAALPENEVGAIVGCKVYRKSAGATFYAFAYSNGDGTFSLCYNDRQVAETSRSVANWTEPHVWTFVFGAQAGAKLYCDGIEIAFTTSIQWNNTDIVTPITFGNDPSGNYPLSGIKIYAVHTAFGTNDNILGPTTASASVKATFESIVVMAPFAEDSMADQLYTFTNYRDTGVATPRLAEIAVLRISEIMPKPTDDQKPGDREGMDVNGLESGWVELENTSDQWADLADYRFIRVNRGKKTDPSGFGNFPSVLIAPKSKFVFYTSERYSNSKDQAVSAFEHGTFDGKPIIMGEELGGVLVWGDKVNPKKSPYVRLYYAPGGNIVSVVDTVVVSSDVPEGYSIIVGEAEEDEGTRRWLCPTPTRGTANTSTDGLTRLGPNVGPLYEKKGQKKTEYANEFAVPVPPAQPGADYVVTLPINGVMNPDGTFKPRNADQITSVKLVYRKDLDDSTRTVGEEVVDTKTTVENWGDQYTATIPSSFFPEAGHLIQWKVLITDSEGVEWTSPSFNNPDDGYEWYGTIVEAPELESATLPTWHMFVDNASKAQMDYDKDDSRYTLPNGARVAIYDSSTSNYYDYVRIDLRGNTSKNFTKKGHGLRFAKAHPLTMRDIVSGEDIEDIRKTSLISEFADPSYMRQMIAFWLWRKMGNLVPFDFPVRCNLNGEFYQLAFNSERFTDELIEDVYELDKYGYSYKNVGTLNKVGTSAGQIEKKTPDDENETDTSVLETSLINPLKEKGAAKSHSEADSDVLTRFVVEKFDLPAWINYLASARITQEMDDVWANICAYYDDAEMKEGVRGTDTWMPLGYDFNLSFGQWYYGDLMDYNVSRFGLMSNQDWFKSHPLYGGWTIIAHRGEGGSGMDGNNGFEAVLQSTKFRRLFLRRLRTLMDQELKAPGTLEGATPFMFEMRKLANLMREDAELDQRKWKRDGSDWRIDVWGDNRPEDMDAGIDDIWEHYVVPRRVHLYVTHSVTNATKTIGYGSNLNAGIPESQSPFEDLIANITVDTSNLANGVVVINNNNAEVVDMSGWTLDTGAKKVYTLPAGTVCDSNDCIYVVSDRRQYIAEHASELTDQVIIGNATFGSDIPEYPLSYPEVETSSGTVSISEEPVVFTAETEDEAVAWVESLTPELTAEQIKDGLTTDKFTVVAKEVPGEPGKYQAVVDLNPLKVDEPEVDTSLEEPMEIEDDTEDPDKKNVSVSISNAIKGLWYGYEVADELGGSAGFENDVDSFERAEGPGHKVKGSPRTQPSGFFRVKVLPAKPVDP